MSDNAPTPEAKSNRTLKWVLLASLLANALVVGFVVGNMGRGGFRPMMGQMMVRGDGRDGPGGPNRPGDPATAQTLRESFQAERPAIDKALKDLAAARKQSAAIIRAETLDAAALDKSLADMRASSAEALESFHRSIAATAAKLDVQHRAPLARLLDRPPQGRGMGAGPGPGPGQGMGGGPRGERERMQGPPPGDMPPLENPPPPPPQ